MNASFWVPTDLPQLTSKCLGSIHFLSSGIAKILRHLAPNKAHGHDMLGIRMIKLCGNSICKPRSINFNDCQNEGKFPHEWKKAKLYPYIGKETNRVWKTIGQSLYFLLSAKFLSVSFITKFLTSLLRKIWSLPINQDLGLGTLVLTNYLLLPMKFIDRLMRELKLEGLP